MKKGFTLIELLVVVAIIGMLSSVVLSSLNQARSGARDAKRAQDIKQIQTALELYHNVNGLYPTQDWSHSTGSGNWSALQTALSPYIQSLPVDPINTQGGTGFNNDEFVYTYYTDSLRSWYMLIWELENSNPAFEDTDGVRRCDTTLFHYGNGTNGIVTSGVSC